MQLVIAVCHVQKRRTAKEATKTSSRAYTNCYEILSDPERDPPPWKSQPEVPSVANSQHYVITEVRAHARASFSVARNETAPITIAAPRLGFTNGARSSRARAICKKMKAFIRCGE